jgi:hypothetical protein
MLRGQKTIDVVYFMDVSCDGKKLMTGWGTDGILYTFEVAPRKPIPITIPLADEKKHIGRADEEGTEPRRIKFNRMPVNRDGKGDLHGETRTTSGIPMGFRSDNHRSSVF